MESALATKMNNGFKCHFCPICNGCACISELPGMGGVRENENFKLNVSDWVRVRGRNIEKISDFIMLPVEERIPKIMLAPMTGAVENIGWGDEESFYAHIVHAASSAGIGITIGDGTPDEKLKFGIRAVESLGNKKAAVFIKPYPNEKIRERISWAQNIASAIGIDIDSYNIKTMRNLVNLEKKTEAQLLEIKEIVRSLGIPFVIKGIFTDEDLELVQKVKPDVAYISNHGGRVETRTGSTADFLEKNAAILQKNCAEIWVDGGIRTPLDIATAMALGAKRILIGRPLATALCHGGEKTMCRKALELNLLHRSFSE